MLTRARFPDRAGADIEGNKPSSLPFFATALPAHGAPLSAKHIFGGGQGAAAQEGRVAKMVALLASKVATTAAGSAGDGAPSAVLTCPPFDEVEFGHTESLEQFTIPTSGMRARVCV